jgi:hypothetical protein
MSKEYINRCNQPDKSDARFQTHRATGETMPLPSLPDQKLTLEVSGFTPESA